MVLGLLSAILADRDFYQVIDVCSEIGFEALEVACWPKQLAARRYAGVTHLDFAGAEEKEIQKQLEYAKKKDIQISALAYYPNPLSPVEEERNMAIAHIHTLIDKAAEYDISLVNTFIGRDRFKNVEENLALYKEIWSPIIEHAEKADVKIGIENCPMLFTADEWPGGNNLASSPVIWDEMFRLIDSDKLGINYDPSHLVIQDMDYLKPIYQYKDKIFHVHLKDTYVDREALDRVGRFAYPLKYITPKLPGFGDINWASVANALYDINYKGVAVVEMEDRNFEESAADVMKGLNIAYRNVKNFF